MTAIHLLKSPMASLTVFNSFTNRSTSAVALPKRSDELGSERKKQRCELFADLRFKQRGGRLTRAAIRPVNTSSDAAA
jgi:hypothetical protein